MDFSKGVKKKVAIGVAIIATIYGVTQFSANKVVAQKIDEVLASEQIQMLSGMLGDRLDYEGAGVDASFSPVIKNITIKPLENDPETIIKIDNLTINEFSGLNFDITLNNVVMSSPRIQNKIQKNVSNKNQSIFTKDGLVINLANRCDSTECKLKLIMTAPKLATIKMEVTSGVSQEIKDAILAVDWHELNYNRKEATIAIQGMMESAIRSQTEAFDRLRDAYRNPDYFNESRSEGKYINLKGIFTPAEADKTNIKLLANLMNILTKNDYSLKIDFDRKDGIESLISTSNIWSGVPDITTAKVIAKAILSRFKGISIEIDVQDEKSYLSTIITGNESTFKNKLSINAPGLLKMTNYGNSFSSKEDHQKIMDMITVAFDTNGNSTGLKLSKDELDLIVKALEKAPLMNTNHLDMNKIRLWLESNTDRLTGGSYSTNHLFNIGKGLLEEDYEHKSELYDYNLSIRTDIGTDIGNPAQQIPRELHTRIKFKELMDVIYSGARVFMGDVEFNSLMKQKDESTSEESIKMMMEMSRAIAGDSMLDMLMTALDVSSTDDLAKVVSEFTKNPDELRLDFLITDEDLSNIDIDRPDIMAPIILKSIKIILKSKQK